MIYIFFTYYFIPQLVMISYIYVIVWNMLC